MKISLRESWNKISEDYQRRSKIGTDDIYYGDFISGEKELKLLGDVKGKRILEIGCGGGQNSIVLAKQGANVCGIDFSENQIAYAKALAKREKVHVDFWVSDMQDLSRFSDNSFDIVLTTVSLLYVENLHKTMSEVNRVLKGGGVFVFSEGHPMAEGRLIRFKGRNVYAISNYFKRRRIFWEDKLSNGTKVKMYSYHRPLQDYFEALLQNGFSIERYLEPQRLPKSKLPPRQKEKIEKSREARKDYESMRLVPFWFIVKARKI
jgi:ubiquinone/menaquinone biosynthesis C-methylase UbiE